MPGKRMVCVMVSVCGSLASVAAGQSAWNNSSGGEWNVAVNWMPTGVPAVSADVTIGIPGMYGVTVSANHTCNSLAVTNPSASLLILDGRTLSIAGPDLANAGAISINPTGVASTASLRFTNASTTLSGPGSIALNAVSAMSHAIMTYSNSANILVQSASHSITGSGQIHNNLVNNGLVKADITGRSLQLATVAKTNNGLLLATNDGELLINVPVDQSGGGVTRADGGVVRFTSGTLNQGIVEAMSGGVARVDGTVTFNDVAVEGPLHVLSGRTLSVVGSIDNEGVITVNPSGGISTAIINFNTNGGAITGSGTIVLNAVNTINNAYLTYSNSANVITHGPDHTITGHGQIHVNLINNGLIKAEGADKRIELVTTPKTNNSLILATDGGEVRSAVNIDQTGGGVTRADGGTITGANATWRGGALEGINGGVVRTGGTMTLENVTVAGDLHVESTRTLHVVETLTNNGLITVNPTSAATAAIVSFSTNGGVINGSGTILLNALNSNVEAYLTYGNSANVITHSAGHTIAGSGQIHTRLLNRGLITADVPGRTLELLTTPKQNVSIMRADGGTIHISGITLDQSAEGAGVLEAINGGAIRTTSAAILGGDINVTGGQMLLTGNTTINGITLVGGAINIPGSRQLNLAGDGFINNGVIHVNSDDSASSAIVSVQSAAVEITGTGELVLDATNTPTHAYITYSNLDNVLTNGVGHTIAGFGQIYVGLVNKGILSPGHQTLTGDRTQTLSLQSTVADVTCEPTSIVRIEIEGPLAGQFDAITGVGGTNFACDGTLIVEHIGGYTGSAIGTTFDIISVGSVTGQFASVVLPNMGARRYDVSYLPNRVRLTETCYADCDLSTGVGVLDIFDFLCFGNKFAAGDPYACECDQTTGPGICDIFDFLCFGNLFSAGCN